MPDTAPRSPDVRADVDSDHSESISTAATPLMTSRRRFLAGTTATGAGLMGVADDRSPADGSSLLSEPRPFETFFDDHLPAQLDEHDLAGATVAVVADGEVALTKGYGSADLAVEEPVRADETLFPVASTSKAVTGTGVMRAVEAGHVNLDTDVNEYLDEITIPDTYPEPVTLEHLGTHSAGFESEYIGQYAPSRNDAGPLGEVLAEGAPSRVHPPGEVAHYSTYGIALAGHVASRAAGTGNFSEYVREALFDPLGMERSTFQAKLSKDLADALTTAYDYDEDAGEFREIDAPFSLRRPGGALVTTATDMAQFMRMHLNGGRIVIDPPQEVEAKPDNGSPMNEEGGAA